MCASATLAEPPARYRRVDSTTLRYESTYTGCRHDHPPQPVNVFFFRVVRFSLHDPWDRANRRDLILSLLRSTDSYELQFDGYLSIISVLSYLSIPSQRFRTTSFSTNTRQPFWRTFLRNSTIAKESLVRNLYIFFKRDSVRSSSSSETRRAKRWSRLMSSNVESLDNASSIVSLERFNFLSYT